MSSEATTGRPASINDTTFDSLADLFLGEDPHREPTHRAIETRGLIVGHLPVLASAWVAQHARDLASNRNGPVAVVSRSSGRVTIDLHGHSERIQPADTLQDAVGHAMQAGVRAWLIRADAVTEASLADSPHLTSLSLLTGHDEAALVAAYRALKGLTAGDHDPSFDEHPQIHIAIMGATNEQGRSAAEKLRKAAESFLQTGIASVSTTDKITASSASRLFDGDADLTIDLLLDQLPTEHELFESATPPTPLRLSHGDHASRIGPVHTHSEPDQPEPTAATRTPTRTHNDRLPSPPRSETLAPLLGLAALQPRCPYADEVELAADAEGRAHLIIHAEGATHTLAGALESLEIARTWLTAHVTLLAAATNNAVRSGPPLDPACHLVVDHAAGARRLLDSPTRVYALAQGRNESICIPLN